LSLGAALSVLGLGERERCGDRDRMMMERVSLSLPSFSLFDRERERDASAAESLQEGDRLDRNSANGRNSN
jgi:hypothetical protein